MSGNLSVKNNSSNNNNLKVVKEEEEGSDAFPVGMRVLVVDDDPLRLVLLENLLRRCQYQVKTCGQAITTLNLLRENKDKFDLVISDVYMPDMDGFKWLELVGLEMDLPVIMMSANGEISAVMKGITHGACDYLLKPVRFEELKNIWQHVIRKKTSEIKDHDYLGRGDETDKINRGTDDEEHGSSANDGLDRTWGSLALLWLRQKKKKKNDDVGIAVAVVKKMLEKCMFLFGFVQVDEEFVSKTVNDIRKKQDCYLQAATKTLLSNVPAQKHCDMNLMEDVKSGELRNLAKEYARAKELVIVEASTMHGIG